MSQRLQGDMAVGETAPVSSGSITWTEAEADFGSTPSYAGVVTVSASGLTAGHRALVLESATTIASTGETADRLEFDQVSMAGVVTSSTTLLVYWASSTPIAGTRKIIYTTFGV